MVEPANTRAAGRDASLPAPSLADEIAARRPTLLEVSGLNVAFPLEGRERRVVAGVSYSIPAGRTLGVVGESGCGKSMTALALMGLVPAPGRVTGSLRFEGRELVGQEETEWRRLRGARIAMVFQEPMTSLNPVMPVGRQIAEAMVLHQAIDWGAAERKAVELIEAVGIPSAKARAKAFPHQLSGGMRQRAMIAMALACRPALLIADEPTTALDVTIQAQILDLMQDLQAEIGMAIQFISHNLAVISEVSDEIIVMYAGRVVERAKSEALFARPLHPYTRGLIATLPDPARRVERLPVIGGGVPDPDTRLAGCRFADRCPLADAGCRAAEPSLDEIEPGHLAACFKARA
ncbi:MAG: ABC transporter ATP-binding protein [Hyphomicrobiales bacterium]|nr:ABC transporter ATP-binding protein [Hyphomicrobiales bacterium]